MAKNKKTGNEFQHPIIDNKIPSATVTKEFIVAIPELSSAAIRLYLYFMGWINYEFRGCDVEASYSTMQKLSGIKDRKTLSKSILELVARGWIGDIKYQFDGSNVYTVNVIPKVNKKLLETVIDKRQHMKEAKKKAESRKNTTNDRSGKFEIGGGKNPTTGGSKNPTYAGSKNPTLSNTNTNTNTNSKKKNEKMQFGEKEAENKNPLPTADSNPTPMPSATAPPNNPPRKKLSRTNTLRLGKRHGELLRESSEYCYLESLLPTLTGTEKQSVSEQMQTITRSLKAQAMKDIGL